MEGAVSALLCRTSDRIAATSEGARELALAVGQRLGVEPRMIGSPGEPGDTPYDDDLRDARGCLLEAGGQVEDALTGGRFPILTSSDCSICITTLPAVARLRPDAVVLWLDAHPDFNDPETTQSGFLGGMCLAAACGAWDAGLGAGTIDPAAWEQTVRVARTAVNADGQTVLTRDPDPEAFTNTYVERAIGLLKSDGVDVVGAGYTPTTVTLNPAGS